MERPYLFTRNTDGHRVKENNIPVLIDTFAIESIVPIGPETTQLRMKSGDCIAVGESMAEVMTAVLGRTSPGIAANVEESHVTELELHANNLKEHIKIKNKSN